ncbi:hypothetical protein IWW36_002383 [Coemansia brasiliensis]|uniref:Uncharacterized protein n=1 Tax=Coemansia brasiliensis TaxID=2650707 RepID=A0A9W8LZI3_9FUNG|nr:hypothetical protein IWW36_002383 [Coemansia brasiliensis]
MGLQYKSTNVEKADIFVFNSSEKKQATYEYNSEEITPENLWNTIKENDIVQDLNMEEYDVYFRPDDNSIHVVGKGLDYNVFLTINRGTGTKIDNFTWYEHVHMPEYEFDEIELTEAEFY